MNSLVSKVSPFIPFVGILEGGITVAEDVAKATAKPSKAAPSEAKSKMEKPKKVVEERVKTEPEEE